MPVTNPTILAVDPGGTTGIAVWHPAVTGWFYAGEVGNGFTGFMDFIEEDGLMYDRYVYESFTVNARTHKLDPVAFEDTTSIIGAVRAEAHAARVPAIRQSSSEGKDFSTNDKLKTAGFWTPTKGGHANDAARHLLTYLFKQRVPSILEKFV